MAAVDPNVTVVVLTYNRAAEVVQTVRRLLRLPEHPHIIVVDNGSPDQTTQLLKAEVPSVQVIRLEKNIGAAARNIGVQTAQTPYVALCDDDTWWEPGALSRGAFACSLSSTCSDQRPCCRGAGGT
jgi:GT2 family glycosyltransferase